MNVEEFKKRTPFLDKVDYDNYSDWYEPAYMEAQSTSKDDFCAMLKDETVRKFVFSVSAAFRANAAAKRDLAKEFSYQRECNRVLRGKVERLRKSISLIQATCDRALSGDGAAATGTPLCGDGVAATKGGEAVRAA